MAPVARMLANTFGVLEPWQSAPSVAGEVEELVQQIDRWASAPVTLVGHSWGAWLSLLVAGERPEKVRRVIAIGSGPFRAKYVAEIRRRRRLRLGPNRWREVRSLERQLLDQRTRPSRSALARLGELTEMADAYDPLPYPPLEGGADPRVFRKVWAEAEQMRRTGALARALRRVHAPVTVLHGAQDPHPIDGVVGPLREAGLVVRVVRLENCGHEPWWERHARTRFLLILRTECARTSDGSKGGRPATKGPRARRSARTSSNRWARSDSA
jgi:pimeloyl-ACP methyl ester carboxylesterase